MQLRDVDVCLNENDSLLELSKLNDIVGNKRIIENMWNKVGVYTIGDLVNWINNCNSHNISFFDAIERIRSQLCYIKKDNVDYHVVSLDYCIDFFLRPLHSRRLFLVDIISVIDTYVPNNSLLPHKYYIREYNTRNHRDETHLHCLSYKYGFPCVVMGFDVNDVMFYDTYDAAYIDAVLDFHKNEFLYRKKWCAFDTIHGDDCDVFFFPLTRNSYWVDVFFTNDDFVNSKTIEYMIPNVDKNMSYNSFQKLEYIDDYKIFKHQFAEVESKTGIYIIFNVSKNKMYVGQGKNLSHRCWDHFRFRNNSIDNVPDIREDFINGDIFYLNFVKLEDTLDFQSLNHLEYAYIEKYNAVIFGYNRSHGITTDWKDMIVNE